MFCARLIRKIKTKTYFVEIYLKTPLRCLAIWMCGYALSLVAIMTKKLLPWWFYLLYSSFIYRFARYYLNI